MPKLKKVVHVMRRFSPDKWGGTENVVFNLSRAFISQGIESRIFCTSMLSEPGSETMGNVPVRRFRYVFPWLGLSGKAKARLRLKGGSPLSFPLFFALLREPGTSVVHAHVLHRLGGMARTVARLKKVPLVVSLHGGCFTLPQEQIDRMTEPFRGKLEWGKFFGWMFGARRVLNDADAIVCVGRSEYEQVRKHYPLKNVFHVPNGVEVARFSKADGARFRSAFGFKSSEKIVLCVSRIDYQKNQIALVRAFASFSVHHPDHWLVLIGPVTVEAYRDEVEREVRRLGIEDKTKLIEGFLPDDPLLPSAYKAAELFVLPTVHEPFGMVVLEAWAAGVPVVASRVGGIPGFATHGENILLAAPDDAGELAMHMAELADNMSLRTNLSRRAFGEVSTYYDWPIIAGRLQQVYEQLMGKR